MFPAAGIPARRVLLVVLAVALAAGWSRQPLVGEWETEIHAGARNVVWGGNYVFQANGDVRYVRRDIGKPASVTVGRYRVDTSADPVRIDIEWENGKTEQGILRFIGKEKELMEMELTTPEKRERPARFGAATMLLTKKVRK